METLEVVSPQVSIPEFWQEKQELLDSALRKAFENRLTLENDGSGVHDPANIPLPFPGCLYIDQFELKWRLIWVYHTGSDSDIQNNLDSGQVRYLKERYYENCYRRFGLSFIVSRLRALGFDTFSELVEAAHHLELLKDFNRESGESTIRCLRCLEYGNHHVILVHQNKLRQTEVDDHPNVPLYCSGCGDEEYIYWFGRMDPFYVSLNGDSKNRAAEEAQRLAITARGLGGYRGNYLPPNLETLMRHARVFKFHRIHLNRLLEGQGREAVERLYDYA